MGTNPIILCRNLYLRRHDPNLVVQSQSYNRLTLSSKIGAVFVQVVLLSVPSIGEPNSTAIRWLLLAFALCMLVGAVFAWVCIPSVQYRSSDPPHRLKNISLEVLAGGWRTWTQNRRASINGGIELSTIRHRRQIPSSRGEDVLLGDGTG